MQLLGVTSPSHYYC